MQSDVAGLPALEFYLYLLALVAVAGYAFYYGFRALRYARLMEDTPTARIRSAPQGFVELEGAIDYAGEGPLAAPLTANPCCWYRYRIEKYDGKRWDTVESDSSIQPFLLRDGTGECLVYPQGATVTSHHRRQWQGDQRHPRAAPAESKGLFRRFSWRLGGSGLGLSFSGSYRYREEYLLPGDKLYALGHFRSRGDADRQRDVHQQVSRILAEWKRNDKALLARFDRNRDGKIDLQEWQEAREQAQRDAQRRQQQLERDLPGHTLAKTRVAGNPFILSTKSQQQMVRGYRRNFGWSMVFFFVCGSLAVWLVNQRFS